MHEGEEKKTILKDLITVHLCFVMLKHKYHFSFTAASLVLWSYSLATWSYRQHFSNTSPLLIGHINCINCNRQILAMLTVCVQEELELTLCFVYVWYIITMCVLAQQSNTSIICKGLNMLGCDGHFVFSQKELGFLKWPSLSLHLLTFPTTCAP